MANTSNANWDLTAPKITEPRRDGATEIKTLRGGLTERVAREHLLFDADNVGGEHIKGSAIPFVQEAAPTDRPDGRVESVSTALAFAVDEGRLWLDTTNDQLYYWDENDVWVPVVAVTATGAIPEAYGEITGVSKTSPSGEFELSFTPRRVTCQIDLPGSDGHCVNFLLPEAGGVEITKESEISVGGSANRLMILTRKDDDLTILLHYDGENRTELNGTWDVYAAGASS